jgi:uncharacterized protein (TIGR03083 family)
MTNLADQVIAALRSGHDDLSAYAAGLGEKDLSGPSGAAEWEVAQVLSHLGSGAEINLGNLRRAGAKPPEGFNQSVWDRWNAMGPVEQRDGFLDADRRLVEAYEALSADERASRRVDVGFMPQPISIAEAARLRLNEFALHAWDVRAGVRPETTLAADAVPLLLESLPAMLGWIAKPDGTRAVLAVELTDPAVSYGLALGDEVSLGERPDSPDGVLRLPAEAWLRLLVGRLGPRWTPRSVVIDGPVGLDTLRRIFPGY